ncbi:hypothetical protein FRC08_003754 [Ceratobasidium sp. 394]|nr:hypothetical protein FRC08_003754 [Ceratobasidium sp. 394]KAG9098652.1 hypothetical protein FS749_003320 [Ceratobasidium sp. UAMH 11750]
MTGTSAKKDKAILQAAKALAAAASSLASAAEALALMYKDDGGTDDLIINGTNVAPSKASIVDYEDSDDEYMIRAREQISIEAAIMRGHGPDILDLTTGRNSSPLGRPGLSSASVNAQSHIAGHVAPNAANHIPAPSPLLAATSPGEERSTSPADATHTLTERNSDEFETAANIPVNSSRAITPTPPRRTWASIATTNYAMWGVAPADRHFETPVPPDEETVNWVATGTGAETPTRTPFQNLLKRWPRPTRLQKDMLEALRTESDMLVCHGNLKSQAHAILVHCMEVLGEQHQSLHREGSISALIIVPQQTTGRLYLNFANELFNDFDLPHKALLLPGGNSDVITEAERMASERIDILISSPRVFINHVNNNPALRIHLANLRFVIFPDAHELIKKDEFLNYQFNMIKKRMPTRAKSPRQIIIASSGSASNEQMEKFTTRAFAPNPSLIVSLSKEDDQMLEILDWQELLRD